MCSSSSSSGGSRSPRRSATRAGRRTRARTTGWRTTPTRCAAGWCGCSRGYGPSPRPSSASCPQAREGLAAAQEDLLAAQKREASLSDLMSSAGCDTVTLGPLSWSIDSAQQLLDDEVATRRALQVRRLPTIHTHHLSCVCRYVYHCCTHILTRAGAAGAN